MFFDRGHFLNRPFLIILWVNGVEEGVPGQRAEAHPVVGAMRPIRGRRSLVGE